MTESTSARPSATLLDALSALVHAPEDRAAFEPAYGSLFWPDELPLRCDDFTELVIGGHLQRLLRHRSMVTLGEARPDHVELWEYVRALAPTWPGFRSERSGADAAKRLIVARRREQAYDRDRAAARWSYCADHLGPFARLGPAATFPTLGAPQLLSLAPPYHALRVMHALSRLEPSLFDHIAGALREPNWRIHLLGAAAALVAPVPALHAPALWYAVDAGSWVSPQLIALLATIDPAFVQAAETRLDAGCPVVPPVGLAPRERHVATGPATVIQRCAKNAAALLEMLDNDPHGRAWAAEVRGRPEVSTLLDQDIDQSARIAHRWHTALLTGQAQVGLMPR